jgi:hypothetical protein
MAVSIMEIKKLIDCNFCLKMYRINHSELTLSAVNREDTSLRFNVHFADVSCIKMPIGWNGNFEIGSESEREELITRLGLPMLGVSPAVKLYKSNEGEVLILGALMLIEPLGQEY